MVALGSRARGAGRVYLTGGSSAVLIGWRGSTVDVDLKLDPEPAGAFEAIGRLKDELGLNVELASPDDFIPVLAGWDARSQFIERHGAIDFYHFDFPSQALAKIERGHHQDLEDVKEMVRRGLVTRAELRETFDQIRPLLIRYPAIDVDAFRDKVERALAEDSP
ncbi:MAG: hypothetical protein IT384_17975 [Deltaproteobacteria bacterium]|nr:hypothetical protein [Deltaproteobacteria bacterium]